MTTAHPSQSAARPSAVAKAALVLAGSALLTIAASIDRAGAEAPFSFATTPGKLPKSVVPVRYAINLKPDLDKLTIAGSETVEVDVLEPADRLVLNAVDLTVSAASIDGEAAAGDAITSDASAQTVTIDFSHFVAVGRHTLSLTYSGKINRFGRGLFYVDYPVEGGRKRMLSSQLEPADARRIFPSWDEPSFKATFALDVTVPDKLRAISNMPVASEQVLGNEEKRVSFQPTPRMSSYLFVLAIGELERVSETVDGTDVGVVAVQGKAANGRYALDSAAELLRYYNAYFGVRYPLPKLDLIAVPGGFGGAMENWGGITFFESRLLFDPQKNSADSRRGIFSIIAHEMAHQWFGDLVTTAWWDNIWLNEGFASWMQAKAAEQLHPEWRTWLNSVGAKQAAMAEDARRTSHPIQHPIANETEANAAFDTITYNKGQAFIRMLESYLGDDTFRAGIRAYMKQRAFSNATTADLWNALAEASGKPVAALAAAYTEQPGVPLVVAETACADGRQRITLRQDRFAIHDSDPKPLHWQVPVGFGSLRAGERDELVLLDGTAEITAGPCGAPVKLNLGDVGYYRVQYDAGMLAALAASIADMPLADRVNLLADSWATVEAGRAPPAAFFGLVDRLGADDSRLIWDQVIRAFAHIDHLERGRPERAAFQAYGRAVLRPVFERLGWDASPGEEADRATLRARLISTLGNFGDEAILTEAKRRFDLFLKEPDKLSVNLRDTVIRLIGRNADRATYDTLLGLARKSTDTSERVRYYAAAASALDPDLARETLGIALTDEITSSIVGTLISDVASEHPELAWSFLQENFAALAQKQGPTFRTNFVANVMGNFSDAAHAAELANFAPAHETSGGRIVAARTQERILTDADFAAQQLPAIEAWMKARANPPH